MNWCVSQHYNQCLVIHAAVVEKNGQAVIMPGTPGSGKSTLCAALVNLAGWRLLSDELTLIDLSTGMVLPNPRPLSLKNQSIQIIRELCPELYCSTIVKDTIKGRVALFRPSADSVRRVDQPARASLVLFPKFEPGARFELNEISKGRAFLELANHSFNYSTLGELGFAAIARQMDTARCYDLQYDGNLLDAVDRLERLVN
jgi:HprK-related kinase A